VDKWAIREFKGVNTAIDSVRLPDALVERSYGASPNDQGDMERIKGKVLNTASTFGRVLTLGQLDFEHKRGVIVHASTSYLWILSPDLSQPEPDVTPLRPVIQ